MAPGGPPLARPPPFENLLWTGEIAAGGRASHRVRLRARARRLDTLQNEDEDDDEDE